MKPHILFVDDAAPIRETLSLYFRKKGYDVTAVTNSAEAIKAAEQGVFTLAILDVDLAGENGLDLLGLFKARQPTFPVIMFTGVNTDDNLLAKAMERGADGFMRKTDSLHELLGEVQRVAPLA